MDARTLYFTAPETVELRRESLGAPAAEDLVVETTASGISAGSELLVYRGEFPEGMPVDETIEALDGEFAYPLPYGYAAVGEVVEAGRDVESSWVGRQVFAFEPHADRFQASATQVVPLPATVDPVAATLLPSVETATTLVLDGAPRVGERVVVFGAGLVGLCTTHVLAGFPLESLVVVEPRAARRELALTFGADRAVAPDDVDSLFDDADERTAGSAGATGVDGADLAYELSGQPETLDAAIDVVGYDGRVVVGSWYGTRRAAVDLGGSFHRDRVSVESSQVSTIDPSLRGRWDRERRFEVAFDHLRALDTDALCSEQVPFADAADAYRLLDQGALDAPHVVLTYR